MGRSNADGIYKIRIAHAVTAHGLGRLHPPLLYLALAEAAQSLAPHVPQNRGLRLRRASEDHRNPDPAGCILHIKPPVLGDIAILGGHSGTAFVSKEEIGNWPIIGWLCKLNDTVFISRSNRMGVAEQINQLRDALEETWAITIFPEGTTTDGSTLLPFKAPLLKVLELPPPGIMVQPIFLNYGENALEIGWTGDESAPSNAWRLLTRRSNFLVEVHFLDPFDPAHYSGRKEIAAEARRRIAKPLSASLGGKAIV
mgnify:CR=1 FL=1